MLAKCFTQRFCVHIESATKCFMCIEIIFFFIRIIENLFFPKLHQKNGLVSQINLNSNRFIDILKRSMLFNNMSEYVGMAVDLHSTCREQIFFLAFYWQIAHVFSILESSLLPFCLRFFCLRSVAQFKIFHGWYFAFLFAILLSFRVFKHFVRSHFFFKFSFAFPFEHQFIEKTRKIQFNSNYFSPFYIFLQFILCIEKQ